MDFDFTRLPAQDRYRLLVSFVAPRPIALVTTVDEHGVHNAAPMSFFNVFSQEPPIVILGLQTRPNGTLKDTVSNIRRSSEFVVHMVDMAIAEQMIVTGINFPRDVDEIDFAGLTALPSVKVAPPRIAESPCAMECVVEQTIDYDKRSIVLGRVVHMHVRDECLDSNRRYVLPAKYQPIARLHADNYIVADRQFELKKPFDLLYHETANGYAEPAAAGSAAR
jgi:flavin reductase (DIM6/NTAB) family NADH-FMN oxidoreductase RutF